jgi:hypothetical protein
MCRRSRPRCRSSSPVRAVASAPISGASPERMRSADSVPRPSDTESECGTRISVHLHQPMRQRSTREIGSVVVHGSTHKESRSLPRLMNSTARASISPGIRRSPKRALRWHRPGTTSLLAVTPMAHCLPKATPRAAGGPATATAEQWSGITTAVAAARAIPGIPRISRAGAPNPHCAHLSATDSSTASPPIDNAQPQSGIHLAVSIRGGGYEQFEAPALSQRRRRYRLHRCVVSRRSSDRPVCDLPASWV